MTTIKNTTKFNVTTTIVHRSGNATEIHLRPLEAKNTASFDKLIDTKVDCEKQVNTHYEISGNNVEIYIES